MADVLAIAIEGADEQSLTALAEGLAGLLRADVRMLDRTSGGDVEQILAELDRPSTALGVLSGTAAHPELGWQVVQRTTKPVVVVPSAGWLPSRQVNRALVPLDRTAESAAAVAPMVKRLCRAGAVIVVLHVFDVMSAPRFWDHDVYAEGVWESEFLARYCDQPGVQMQLRTGVTWEHILDVAASEEADVILLAWSQRLDEDRAQTVRRTLEKADVPVMLLPVRP